MLKGRVLRGGHVACVCVCSEVSLATCPVLRAGHLRKVSFSAMGNCYPYYTLKRCAVGVLVCGAVVSHKTRTDTLTYTYPHPHILTRDTAVGEFERPSKLYSMAFHFISLLQATNIICTYSTQSNNNNNDDNQREKEMKRKSALEWVLSI